MSGHRKRRLAWGENEAASLVGERSLATFVFAAKQLGLVGGAATTAAGGTGVARRAGIAGHDHGTGIAAAGIARRRGAGVAASAGAAPGATGTTGRRRRTAGMNRRRQGRHCETGNAGRRQNFVKNICRHENLSLAELIIATFGRPGPVRGSARCDVAWSDHLYADSETGKSVP